MKKTSFKNLIYIPLFILGIAVGYFFITFHPQSKQKDLRYIFDLISNYYVDTIDIDNLEKELIPIVLEKLDPHSRYIPRKESDLENERLNGEFFGIGVTFNTIIDTPVIINVLPSSPSERAGLKSGDRLIMADSTSLTRDGLNADSVRNILLGAYHSIVSLKIIRKDSIFTTPIIRDIVPIKSVDVSHMLSSSTGIIRITQWGATTFNEIILAISQLEAKGMKKLILDLRDNSGGYLDASVQVANLFLKKGDLIVYTKGKAFAQEEFRANGLGNMQKTPLVILVNELSASASEIFAGAMQDHDRATIIGRRTFGKALVQKPFYLPDSSQIRLTIARYYTPSGRCIQKKYTLGDLTSYQNDLINRYKSGEVFDKKTKKDKGLKQFKTDSGKIVYEHSGISPSIIIPIDSLGVNQYYINILRNQLINEFAFHYVDKNRETLNKFRDFHSLNQYFIKDKSIIKQFLVFTKSKGIPYKDKMFNEAKSLIQRDLFASIASYLLGTEASYLFFHQEDQAIKKALKVLNQESK